jgi:hypothetical protein
MNPGTKLHRISTVTSTRAHLPGVGGCLALLHLDEGGSVIKP